MTHPVENRANAKISYILVTYNQEHFVEESLVSALSQKCEPLEIIVSDDCSPDATFEVIERIVKAYDGPHKVTMRRNPKNVGLSENLNAAWNIATGDFIILQAGDDIAREDRAAKLIDRWKDTSKPVDLVVSHFEEIDVDGKSTGFIKTNVAFTPDLSKNVLEWECGATGACASYSRKIFDKYGQLDPRVISEDWVYSFRAWLESGIAVTEEPLLFHRTHDQALSVSFRKGNIGAIGDRKSRMKKRALAAGNAQGIAREWLKAAKLSTRKGEKSLVDQLEHLVAIRDLEAKAYDSSPLKALFLIPPLLIKGAGLKNAIKVFARNVLRKQ